MISAQNQTTWPSADSFLRTSPFAKYLHLASPPPLLRSMGRSERNCIARHLLDLDTHDRYLRFGYLVSDDQLQRYVDNLDFERNEVFGIYDRRLELIAMAHLAFAPDGNHDSCAELGLSVAKRARGRGYGARLFARAAIVARNEGVGLVIHMLSENAAMLKIVSNAGASVVRSGSECEAYLELPAVTWDRRLVEVALEHLSQIDYQLNARAKQFWAYLSAALRCRNANGVAFSRRAPAPALRLIGTSEHCSARM